jgi:hypothetical protein
VLPEPASPEVEPVSSPVEEVVNPWVVNPLDDELSSSEAAPPSPHAGATTSRHDPTIFSP